MFPTLHDKFMVVPVKVWCFTSVHSTPKWKDITKKGRLPRLVKGDRSVRITYSYADNIDARTHSAAKVIERLYAAASSDPKTEHSLSIRLLLSC